MTIIDVREGETYEQAEARQRAEQMGAIEREPVQTSAPVPAYEDADRPEVNERWSIGSVAELDWALERIAALEAEQASNAAIIEEKIAWLKLRLERINATPANGIAFFKGRIGEYAQAHRDELLGGGKKKSRTLPHGSVGWKKVGGGLKVLDKDALLNWAREQPVELGLVRIKEEPAVDEVKRAFKTNGEVPPGCDVDPERDELVIKTVQEA